MEPSAPHKQIFTRPPTLHLFKRATLFVTLGTALLLLSLFVKEQDLWRGTVTSSSTPLLLHESANYTSTPQRPIIFYPKPHKTGSTFTASSMGMAVLRAGGRVAPCEVSETFNNRAIYYGMVRGYDFLGCHFDMRKLNIPALLRGPREVVFVTTIREPLSWFLSIAVHVYEKTLGVTVNTKELLFKAIDKALDPQDKRVSKILAKIEGEYGVYISSSNEDIAIAASIYTYIFDHKTAEEEIKAALVEMGYAPSRPSMVREGTYKSEWYGDYRKKEVDKAIRFLAAIYTQFGKIRSARQMQRTKFANLGRDGEVEVIRSGAWGSKGKFEKAP